VSYTPADVRALTPVRRSVEERAPLPDRRDVFLCHAWDDRGGAAKELHDLLESRGFFNVNCCVQVNALMEALFTSRVWWLVTAGLRGAGAAGSRVSSLRVEPGEMGSRPQSGSGSVWFSTRRFSIHACGIMFP
jgi:hypothetical protein